MREYSEKFPNKETWHKSHKQNGYYIPSITTYDWKWAVYLDLNNLRKFLLNHCSFFILFILFIYLVPRRNKIYSATKGVHRISREECVEIINNFNPKLKVSGKFLIVCIFVLIFIF